MRAEERDRAPFPQADAEFALVAHRRAAREQIGDEVQLIGQQALDRQRRSDTRPALGQGGVSRIVAFGRENRAALR